MLTICVYTEAVGARGVLGEIIDCERPAACLSRSKLEECDSRQSAWSHGTNRMRQFKWTSKDTVGEFKATRQSKIGWKVQFKADRSSRQYGSQGKLISTNLV